MNSLEKARNTIDKIDEQLASLFEARMKLTEIVAAYKKSTTWRSLMKAVKRRFSKKQNRESASRI
ncbi:chorismate mutase [Allobaculum sp. Allo2]|uniref:chorismate mutase n=1 Tax=Allobaculum sp. Allo2 TaxID=2853432 RepID=UPI001F60680A|nr:chorismate mutase [Allobaculum sp. Allo2]